VNKSVQITAKDNGSDPRYVEKFDLEQNRTAQNRMFY